MIQGGVERDMDLNKLSPIAGSKKNRKRIGRGPGSGTGKTSGKGQKGQKARSGGNLPLAFEGGQMPLVQRLPKRGFHNRFATRLAEVNVGSLSKFEAGSTVGLAQLIEARLVKQPGDGVKLLGNGEIDRALTVQVTRISKAARAKIEAAGGTVELV
jgi:large subunit ribosomal protein L15